MPKIYLNKNVMEFIEDPFQLKGSIPLKQGDTGGGQTDILTKNFRKSQLQMPRLVTNVMLLPGNL